MTGSLWLTLAGLCILGAISPGPSMVVIIRHTLHNGCRHGLVASASHALGIGIFAILALAGVNTLMYLHPLLFQLLVLLGGLYLAWLGIKALKAGHVRLETDAADYPQDSLWVAARDGLLIVLFNPKIALFFLALLSQFIGPNLSWFDWLLLWLMISLIDCGCYVMITLLLSQPSVLQRFRRQHIWVNRISGLILLGLALRVLLPI